MAKAITREVNLMAELQHPNVVRLLEVMNSATHIYMVLELIKGRELYDEIIDKGHLNEATARAYFVQIVEGVTYLHSQGVAHRSVVSATKYYV